MPFCACGSIQVKGILHSVVVRFAHDNSAQDDNDICFGKDLKILQIGAAGGVDTVGSS
jgi:hypothetical protein